MTELTLGEETITTFTQAVARVSAVAHAKLPPELHGSLERATALIKHHHVWMDEDGRHGQVLSSDGTTWYVCNGHCTCMGVTHTPQGLCKHRLSLAIYRRASELLAQAGSRGQAAGADGVPCLFPLTPSLPHSLPEAPASVNVRLCIGGADVQWTLRDSDEDRLAARLERLLARFPQAPPAAAPAQSAPAGMAQPTPEGWCLIHNLQMSRQSNERGSWFSHRAPDGGWCRGKAPRA